MIKVKIGSDEMNASDIDSAWVNQQINRRRKDGESVYVIVTIERPPLNMVLSTPTCTTAYGSSRKANKSEQEIFDLWDKHKLNRNDFTGGNLIAFLRQIA